MENTNENKLGGGIIVVSILILISSVFSSFSSISILMNRSLYEKTYKELGMTLPSNTMYIISCIICCYYIICNSYIIKKVIRNIWILHCNNY